MCMVAVAIALGLAASAAEPVKVAIIDETASTRATAHEVVVPAPIGDVWQAVSTLEGWRTWAAPVTWADPKDPTSIESSYDVNATPGNGTTITQRVVLSVPPRLYAWRTIKAPDDFRNFGALSQVSWLLELMPEGSDRTRVRLTGSGYPRTAAGDEVLKFFERGNVISLEFLRQRFAEGPIDWSSQSKFTAGAK